MENYLPKARQSFFDFDQELQEFKEELSKFLQQVAEEYAGGVYRTHTTKDDRKAYMAKRLMEHLKTL